ncbi:MAG TPA: hypothetical protein VJM34_18670 [Novosphingobium sp.]|nr:hypothetical protein [Novosphingobium sp.]
MGGDRVGIAGIAGEPAATSDGPAGVLAQRPAWDRYALWRKWDARAVLLLLLLLAAVSAIVPIHAGDSGVETKGFAENLAADTGPERARDDDLALYDRAIARIRAGENYYDFIVGEQRRADYPVRPGIAVRLPTLAYIDAAIREPGQIVAALALLLGVLAAWRRRLNDEPGMDRRHIRLAMALLFVGASLGLNRSYFALHELWAGMLLALAFGLHRPGGKWGWALVAAALALAIRETALPFVLLMAALALWRRDWKEGAAWSALAVAFLAALAVHLSIIDGQVLPGDKTGQGWLTLRGLSGWLSNVALSSNLRFLPHWLAGPAVVMMVFGWSAWKTPAGLFGTLLYLGYGLVFMIAGRPDNFYWGAMVAPAMFVGLAFVPGGLASLVRAAALTK